MRRPQRRSLMVLAALFVILGVLAVVQTFANRTGNLDRKAANTAAG